MRFVDDMCDQFKHHPDVRQRFEVRKNLVTSLLNMCFHAGFYHAGVAAEAA